jgi:hypothetical protein
MLGFDAPAYPTGAVPACHKEPACTTAARALAHQPAQMDSGFGRSIGVAYAPLVQAGLTCRRGRAAPLKAHRT